MSVWLSVWLSMLCVCVVVHDTGTYYPNPVACARAHVGVVIQVLVRHTYPYLCAWCIVSFIVSFFVSFFSRYKPFVTMDNLVSLQPNLHCGMRHLGETREESTV